MSDPTFDLILRFKTAAERQGFLYYWFELGGDASAGLATQCHPETPSWMEDPPALDVERIDQLEEQERYGWYDAPYEGFAKSEW